MAGIYKRTKRLTNKKQTEHSIFFKKRNKK